MKNLILFFLITKVSLFVYGQDACGSVLPVGLVDGPDSTQTSDHDGEFYSLEVNPLNPSTAFIGTEGNGIFKTKDGGTSWQWLRQGFHYLPGPNSYADSYDIAINPSDTNEVFAAMNGGPGPLSGNYPCTMGGIYVSNNGGQTWQQRNCGLTSGSEISVFVDQLHPDTLFTASFGYPRSINSYPDTFYYGGIYKSIDHALSWTATNIPTGANRQGFGKFQWTGDTVTGYCLDRRFPHQSLGLIRSTDRGNNWYTFTNPLNGRILGDFSVSKDGKTIYAIDRDSVIYATHNAGNTWSSIHLPFFSFISIHPTNSNIVLFSKETDLYKSISGINSANINDTAYTKVASFPYRIENIVFAPSDPCIVYVSTRGYRVYKSIDCGNSFSLIANLRNIIQQTVSIEEKMIYSQKIEVFPNPITTENSIVLKGLKEQENYDITLTEIDGKKLIERFVITNSSSLIINDLPRLSKGIYFLRISTDKELSIQKIIVD